MIPIGAFSIVLAVVNHYPEIEVEIAMNLDTHSRQLIEEMNRYYDARAPWHDEYMSHSSQERMEKLLNPIVDNIESFISGKQIIEIACGTGNWTQVLAGRAKLVTALDVSPEALQLAAEKLSDNKNVLLVECDAYNLDSMDGSFDVAFAADWWSHIPKSILPEFLDSIGRKLRIGGKAIFLDMTFKDTFREESSYMDSDGNRVSQRDLPDGSSYDVVKNFPSESELRQLLSGYARQIDYYEFDSLQRWMVVFERK